MADLSKIDGLLQEIANKLERLVTLSVVTVVCPLQVVPTDEQGNPVADPAAARDWKLAPPPAGQAQAWSTEINLLDGKIRDTITESFVTGNLTSLTDYHKSQVVEAKAIVHGNIEALVSLAKMIRDMFPHTP